jgi:hypothetical protein
MPNRDKTVQDKSQPTTARPREPGEPTDEARKINSDVGLSPAIQQGAGALANIGKGTAKDRFGKEP